MKTIVCLLIRVYQVVLGGRYGLLSLFVGGGCKQSPTCSEYTIREVRNVGAVRGIYRGAKRVLTCY